MEISDILKCKCCMDIFPEDIKKAQPIYLDLMLRYHPDRCSDPRAAAASAVINELFGKLKKSHLSRVKNFRSGSRSMDIKYLMDIPQEYGSEYIGENTVYLLIEKDFTDCFYDSKARHDGFFRKNLPPDILARSQAFLPSVTDITETDEGLLLEVKKNTGELALTKVLEHYGDSFDSKHAAWIISRLLGICCYAEVRGIVWNCLTEENLFIDPEQHSVRVASGWWFAAEEGCKMTGVQSSVYDSLPAVTRSDGISRHINDLECVKALARRIFPADAPRAILDYAESICSPAAFEEMEKWENAIVKGFGGRKFTHMNIRLPDIAG